MPAWRFLLDENIDPKVATYLRKADLFAFHVRDAIGQGADDTTRCKGGSCLALAQPACRSPLGRRRA